MPMVIVSRSSTISEGARIVEPAQHPHWLRRPAMGRELSDVVLFPKQAKLNLIWHNIFVPLGQTYQCRPEGIRAYRVGMSFQASSDRNGWG